MGLASLFAWGAGHAFETHWSLYGLYMIGGVVIGWHLQTDEEKAATKQWWYDRL